MKDTAAYKFISDFYGDRVANRSQVKLMNHIDEGIEILTMIGASDDAKEAFCMHPIVQSQDDLERNQNWVLDIDPNVLRPRVMLLAMEYRNIANQYLSHRAINGIDEIVLSPIKDVNDMLIADKIQNYKDFLIYHQATHPRSRELTHYFCNWLKRLDIVDVFETYYGLKTSSWTKVTK